MPFLEQPPKQTHSKNNHEQKDPQTDVKTILDMQKRLAFRLLNKECKDIKELTSDYMREWIKHNGSEFGNIQMLVEIFYGEIQYS